MAGAESVNPLRVSLVALASRFGSRETSRASTRSRRRRRDRVLQYLRCRPRAGSSSGCPWLTCCSAHCWPAPSRCRPMSSPAPVLSGGPERCPLVYREARATAPWSPGPSLRLSPFSSALLVDGYPKLIVGESSLREGGEVDHSQARAHLCYTSKAPVGGGASLFILVLYISGPSPADPPTHSLTPSDPRIRLPCSLKRAGCRAQSEPACSPSAANPRKRALPGRET